MGAVRLNQMGYSLNGAKQFVFAGEGDTFYLYQSNNNMLRYEGKLEKKGFDEASGDLICTGEFSQFQIPGDYYIKVKEEVSEIFTISDEQIVKCTDALLKAFYYQRCGTELTGEYAGLWKHPACHLQPSYLFGQAAEDHLNQPGQRISLDTSGGWHDAGDYGRYTIATVKTAADLLLAYQHFTAAFLHSLPIPESTKEEADILHEVRTGLDFLFKMQRKEDGAVYTKVATRYFPGMLMPQEDKEPLFVFDISTPASAGFAAVMALAAQIYKEIDLPYSIKCLHAARKAYLWLKQNPDPVLFTNPPQVDSGEYSDDCDTDERYWAAAQLYCATGEEGYHEDFLAYYSRLKNRLSLGWKDVGGYGSIAYLLSDRPVKQEVYAALKQEWLSYAVQLAERSKLGYGITLSRKDYIWGSLMNLQNQSIHLILAERLHNQPVYRKLIRRNWDYLFGMNPMDLSYVTGLGTRSVKHPHHRPSAADGVEPPIPGLVAGGPCDSLLDDIARRCCKGLPPAKCYVDHLDSYSTNEVDIYWNSPAVYTGAYLCCAEVMAYL